MKSGLLALAASPVVAGAATDSESHQHGASGQYGALIQEALHCIDTGNACTAHCISDMRGGSTELLECLVRPCVLLQCFALWAKQGSLFRLLIN